ncbi:MAG: stage IV sporulation protein A [Clostridiales bacterium]|jgi:stage IV sporulation protein A|nr:stage IV sporulation protein A [Clostridiales bacterium]
MESFDLYKDIARRTNGDIYIGVVGPVRTGKSTFIRKFMEAFVLENIADQFKRQRAVDEMPQSADGKTIMTTQPKFVPAESVEILLNDGSVKLNVRLIDCVGYLVDGALGHTENGRERYVVTPWSDSEMPFEKAAEIGTKKVINDHSTIGIVVTTDGSITELDRGKYLAAEERVVGELKAIGKPFVVILNSKNPESADAINLKSVLEERYGAPVLLKNVEETDKEDINEILEAVLSEFPVKVVDVHFPRWLQSLGNAHPIVKDIAARALKAAEHLIKMKDYRESVFQDFEESEYLTGSGNARIDMGRGRIAFDILPKPDLFYSILSAIAGEDVSDEYVMMKLIRRLKVADKEYAKLVSALSDVENFGYGIVTPTMEEMSLEEPVIVKQGGKYGVKLKASAPSLHIMKVDVEAEVSPIIGTEQQSEDMIKYLLSEFENNKQGIWETNMFGKSLNMMVKEGLHNKLSAVPEDARNKMRKTMSRIVNEGKGGVVCILL